MRKAKHGTLLGQLVDPKLISGMGADDGQLEPFGQLRRAARMVNMGMRQPNLLKLSVCVFNRRQQPIQIATGIDDGRFFGLIAPNDGAILRKRRDGDGNVMQHDGPEVAMKL
jgi:hypothetical protein